MSKQRGNGTGSFETTAQGKTRWKIMVGYRPDGSPDIRRGTSKATGKAGRREAEREVLLAKEQPQSKPSKLLMSEWADMWYESYEGKVEASTYSGYRYTVAHIKETWGDRTLTDMGVSVIEDGLAALGKKVGFRYVGQIKTMLGQMMRRAEAIGLVPPGGNKVPLLDRRKNKNPTPQSKDSYTIFELRRLIRELPDERMGHVARVMLSCGMRGQEVLALGPADIRREEINGEPGTEWRKQYAWAIIIDKAVKMVDGVPHMGGVKSAAGTRKIYVPGAAIPSAVWLRDHPQGGALILAENNKILSPKVFRKRYRDCIAMVPGIRVLLPHEARHTVVTIHMKDLRTDPKVGQSQFGQSDMATTAGYVRIDDGAKREAANAYSDILTGEIRQ
jgi:integrase